MNKSVKSFYNSKGWEIDQSGDYFDAISFEDLRKVSQKYLIKNRLSLRKHFPKYGDLILDCASGPIQYQEYLEYSKHYKKRVCVDFSLEALNIAKAKDPKRIDILHGDMIQIDFKSEKYSTILCIHTLYHLPKKEQIKMIKKFKRSIKKNGTILIVYSNPNFLLERIKNIIKKCNQRKPEFLFERFSIKEIKQKFPETQIIPFRCLSGEDMKRILPNNFFTKIILFFIGKVEPFLPLFLMQYYLIKFEN